MFLVFPHLNLLLLNICRFCYCGSVPGSSDDELSLPDEPNLDETKGGTFLGLEEIGVFLSYLAAKKGILIPRFIGHISCCLQSNFVFLSMMIMGVMVLLDQE